MLQQPYVSRPEAEDFLKELQAALTTPVESPVLFHVWGIGGVGKSTLLKKIVQDFTTAAIPLVADSPIAFGFTEGIDTPVDLMQKLHGLLKNQFLNPSFFGRGFANQRDPFLDRYTQYFDAIHQLQREAPDGKGGVSPEQLGTVKQLLQGLAQVGGAAATATGNPIVGGALMTASKGTDAVVDGATLALSEKDRIQSLVQAHRATREKRDLQELLLNPLPRLTEAFVASLGQWSEQKPIILMLDTYEKADLATIDTWLWQSLLSNTNLQQYPIRVVVAGRYHLLRRQEWATLQQNRACVKCYGPEKFTPEQTQEYLAEIDITDPATVQRIYQVTKGWPYYLNKIRETPQAITLNSLTQDLATFLVNHLSPEMQEKAKQLAQTAACCRWFDATLIESLAQQLQISPPTFRNRSAQTQTACFAWLKEQTFVEPTAKGRLRVDDVARDVFRASLWQENQPMFERAHDLLARYFKAKSDQVVPASTATSEKYENPDWRELRAEYLYYLLFTQQPTSHNTWLSHLLEATYLRQALLVQLPLQAVMAESDLAEHPHLRYPIRQFLITIRPAIEYGWAVLEEDPIDYDYNATHFDLTKPKIDRAITACLNDGEDFKGLAQFVAAYYQSKRCSANQKKDRLQAAKNKVTSLKEREPSGLIADIYLYKLGSSFYVANLLEETVACCDAALTIKPDKHEALYNKGVALLALDRKKEAIAAYDASLALNLDKYEALYNKGLVLANLGRYEEAITAYDASLALNPDDYGVLNNKGCVLDKLGCYEEAIAAYDAALALQPDAHAALNNKGIALGNLGRYEEEIAAYDAALAVKPDKDVALCNKGIALGNLDRYEEAIAA